MRIPKHVLLILIFSTLLAACRSTPTVGPAISTVRLPSLTATIISPGQPPQATPTAIPTPSPQVSTTPAPTATATPPPLSLEQQAAARQALLAAGQPCPEPATSFTCLRLDVPLDHFTAGSPTIPVHFALRPAYGERKGLLFFHAGGDGEALSRAERLIQLLPPALLANFDVVFMDQRGAGLSGRLSCPTATTNYYRSQADPFTLAGETALVQAAQTFVQSCVEEIGISTTLPTGYLNYLGTSQAVEDLERFRQAIGAEQFWLYGRSYGAQFALSYAGAYPQRLAGLILDGSLDPSLPALEGLRLQTEATAATIVRTLQACNADLDCAAAHDGDAAAAFDRLRAELAAAPATINFPLSFGGADGRSFSLSDFTLTAIWNQDHETLRGEWLRALAAANRQDWLPMVRLYYETIGVDPDTLQPLDESVSAAIYYAVQCRDYSYYSGAPDERASAYLLAGDAIDAAYPTAARNFYFDLPCLFWPGAPGETARPEPPLLPGVPTLLLAATADTAAPYSHALKLAASMDQAALVTGEDSHHVLLRTQDVCVQAVVSNFLLNGQLPAERQTICPGKMILPFGQ